MVIGVRRSWFIKVTMLKDFVVPELKRMSNMHMLSFVCEHRGMHELGFFVAMTGSS